MVLQAHKIHTNHAQCAYYCLSVTANPDELTGYKKLSCEIQIATESFWISFFINMIEINVVIQNSIARSNSVIWDHSNNWFYSEPGYAQPENLFILEALQVACEQYNGSLVEIFYEHGITILQLIDKMDFVDVVKNSHKWYKIISLSLSQCSFYTHLSLPAKVRKDWHEKLESLSLFPSKNQQK